MFDHCDGMDSDQFCEAVRIILRTPYDMRRRWWRRLTGVSTIGHGHPRRAMRPHKVLHERFNPDNPYLYRWILFRLPFGLLTVYLHRIVRPDDDPDPHDHPWLFWCVYILEGGYLEQIDPRPDPPGSPWTALFYSRHRGYFGINGRHLHRIDSLIGEDSWSLVIAGPKVREWGFVDRLTQCWTHWNSYVSGERC
jgi:hypothetical protein